jgi:hypothetical protein
VPGTELRIGDLVVCEAGRPRRRRRRRRGRERRRIGHHRRVRSGHPGAGWRPERPLAEPLPRRTTGGTKVLSDRIVIKITTRPGETFIDR